MQSKSITLCCVAFQFGFINYEVGDSKKLFFHVKEVQDGVELQAGDEVEFSVILNQRTGKCSACNVWRVWWGFGIEGIVPGTVSASQQGPAGWACLSWLFLEQELCVPAACRESCTWELSALPGDPVQAAAAALPALPNYRWLVLFLPYS